MYNFSVIKLKIEFQFEILLWVAVFTNGRQQEQIEGE